MSSESFPRSIPRHLTAVEFSSGAVEQVGQFTFIRRAGKGGYVVARGQNHRAGPAALTATSVWNARVLATVLERASADQR